MAERRVTLDIGCGKRNVLKNYGFDSEPFVALDISRQFLKQRQNGFKDRSLVQARAESLPFSSESVDEVFSVHVLEHVEDFDQTLEEIERVTKEGGALTIGVPHPRLESILSRFDDNYHSDYHHRRVINGSQLEGKLNSHNFEIRNIKTRGFVGAVIISLSFFLHLKVLRDRYMESQSGDLITDHNTDFSKGEKTKSMVNATRGLVEKILLTKSMSGVLKLLDELYPFETYVEAIKKLNPQTLDKVPHS